MVAMRAIVIILSCLVLACCGNSQNKSNSTTTSGDQAAFGRANDDAIARYDAADNELKKSIVRKNRDRDALAAASGGSFSNWSGTLQRLGTDHNGDAFIEVALDGCKCILQTTYNSISDVLEPTVITMGTPMFSTLTNMHEGDRIFVSGQILHEKSLTESGSIHDPAWITRFSDVSAHAAAVSSSDNGGSEADGENTPPTTETTAPPTETTTAPTTDTAPTKRQQGTNSVEIPFVGCKSDGQVGPLDAPHGTSVAVNIDPQSARRLTYYKAEEGRGVIGPKGWFCFGLYGSDGWILIVTPHPVDSTNLFSTKANGLIGPAIQLSASSGETSGRFEVAQVAARIFPSQKAFVQQIIAEGIEPSSDFAFVPYPADRLTYKTARIVEFETPANKPGLGTSSRLQQDANPIEGVAILLVDDPPSLLLLTARLPSDTRDLTPLIVHQTEGLGAVPSTGQQSVPSDIEGSDPALDVVTRFYKALEHGDGQTASSLVIPEKRTVGPLSAGDLTHFYSGLAEPLHLENVTPVLPGTVVAHYTYTPRAGARCSGAATVLVTTRSGEPLIERIKANSGC
jgi:hypothetical protein